MLKSEAEGIQDSQEHCCSQQTNQCLFKNVVSAMINHFSPLLSKIIQRFLFNVQVGKQGETVAAYIAELRALSENCIYETHWSQCCATGLYVLNNFKQQHHPLLSNQCNSGI